MCPHIYIIHIHLSISTSCGSAWLLHLVPLVTMFGFKRVPWIDIVIIIIDMVNTILITITSLLRYRIMLRDWLDNCCEDCWFSVRKRFSPQERCDGRPEPCKRLPTPSQSPALRYHDDEEDEAEEEAEQDDDVREDEDVEVTVILRTLRWQSRGTRCSTSEAMRIMRIMLTINMMMMMMMRMKTVMMTMMKVMMMMMRKVTKVLLFDLEASQCSVVASSSNVRLNDRNKSGDDCDDVDYFGDDDDDYDGWRWWWCPTHSSGRQWHTLPDLEPPLQPQQCWSYCHCHYHCDHCHRNWS